MQHAETACTCLLLYVFCTVLLLKLQETLKQVSMRLPVSAAMALGSAFLYGGAAVSMNFINKLTLQVFGLANTLLLLQMSAVVIVVAALKVRSPHNLNRVQADGDAGQIGSTIISPLVFPSMTSGSRVSASVCHFT